MSQPFTAENSRKSLKWAVLLALLIDVPFILVPLFSSGEPEPVLLLVMFIPFAISGLIVYSSYAARRMEYVLENDALRVSFPLSPLRISYTKIRCAGKVETSLRFRLFGGRLPGVHWGAFTTSSLGNAQVYATRYKGEFVILELSDGEKILISPREPNAFLEALRGKSAFATPTPTEVVEPRIDQRLAYAQVAVVTIAWLALVYYVASIYSGLPEIIPVHFGLNGVPNRYGNKVELIILVVISALFPMLNTTFAVKFGKCNKGLTLFLSVVFLLAVGLFVLVVNQILQAI
ncbi:MAG: PH domain-containing protein [Candidatus Bathyarchaeota archaeon]